LSTLALLYHGINIFGAHIFMLSGIIQSFSRNKIHVIVADIISITRIYG